MDIQLWMHPIDPRRLVERRKAESSSEVAARVLKARMVQKERFAGEGVFCNEGMNSRLIDRHCRLDAGCRSLMEKIIGRMGLSARACSRILRLARTIADLAGSSDIRPSHLSEAAGYRFLDRQDFRG